MIEHEMTGYVRMQLSWKQILFHRGCSFNLKSILGAGLIAGGREGRENRHTVFFTPFFPRGTEIEEEFHDDLTKPRNVHCKTEWNTLRTPFTASTSGGRRRKAQRFGRRIRMQSSPTVPRDCIEPVIPQRG